MGCTTITTEAVCYEDATGFRRSLVAHYEHGTNAIGKPVLQSLHYTLADGVTVVDTVAGGGAVTVGACSGTDLGFRFVQPGGINIASGTFAATHDPASNGKTFTFFGTHPAFTVTATEAGEPGSANAVRVALPGSVVYLVKGESKSWAAPLPGQYLEAGTIIDCLGDSAASVHWTV